MAAEVAAPLARTQEIVLINDGSNSGSIKLSNEITKLIGTIPPSVQALTGVDLKKVCSSFYVDFRGKFSEYGYHLPRSFLKCGFIWSFT